MQRHILSCLKGKICSPHSNYKHTVVCWFCCICKVENRDNNQWQFFDNISCNKKSNGLNIEDISILCSLSHSLYNACRDYICSCTRQESFLSNALLLLKWWMGLCVRQILLKKKYFSVTVPVQYMSCWTGLNVLIMFVHMIILSNRQITIWNCIKNYVQVNSDLPFGDSKTGILKFTLRSILSSLCKRSLCNL